MQRRIQSVVLNDSEQKLSIENTEVLMHRYRRVSRRLMAALAVTIVLGLFFYLHNLKRTRAAESARLAQESRSVQTLQKTRDAKLLPDVAPAVVPVAGSTPATVIPAALVTQTPGIASPGGASTTPSSPASRPAVASVAKPAPGPSTPSSALASATPAAPTPPSVATPAVSTFSPTSLSDARSKADAGDLIAARTLYSDALTSGRLSPADADAARLAAAAINQKLIFSPRKYPDDPWALPYAVQSGERLSTIASKNIVTWELLARVNAIEPKRLRSNTTIKVIKGPFHAVVSKSKFRMDMYLGSPGEPGAVYVTSFPVGLGKDSSTPTGTWQVQAGNKIRNPKYYSPRGEGVIDASDPKNPLGGYWIGLEGLDGQAVGKNSYGVHGTIDPNSIGKMESMGCIRLKADDIALVYELLVEGKSKVVVKD